MFRTATETAGHTAQDVKRREVAAPVMLHVCRRSVRNEPDRGGTGGDAAGCRFPSIPGGYEVRARFCWELRTARHGFDSRRLPFQKPRGHSFSSARGSA